MKYYFLYLILRLFTGNPLMALLLLAVIYAAVDRRFIGILPDFLQPWRRWQKISGLKREIHAYPHDGRILYELGALLVEQGKAKEGLRYLEKAREQMPEHPDVQYFLGLALFKNGYQEKGREALEKALMLNPRVQYGAPYIYLIDYYLNRGNNGAIVAQYLKKIEEFGSPEYYYKLGCIFQKAGQQNKAKEMFGEAVANFKGYPAFYKKKQRSWALRAKMRTLFLK